VCLNDAAAACLLLQTAFYKLQPSKVADSPEENEKERDIHEATWHILKDILARQIICAHIQS
jgi:hypothetical protein